MALDAAVVVTQSHYINHRDSQWDYFLTYLDFIDDLANGGSYYKENSIEWCDKVWRRMLYTERGEARLYQVGDRLYRQLYVILEYGIEGYITDTNDRV